MPTETDQTLIPRPCNVIEEPFSSEDNGDIMSPTSCTSTDDIAIEVPFSFEHSRYIPQETSSTEVQRGKSTGVQQHSPRAPLRTRYSIPDVIDVRFSSEDEGDIMRPVTGPSTNDIVIHDPFSSENWRGNRSSTGGRHVLEDATPMEIQRGTSTELQQHSTQSLLRRTYDHTTTTSCAQDNPRPVLLQPRRALFCAKCGKDNKNNLGDFCSDCGTLLQNITDKFMLLWQEFETLPRSTLISIQATTSWGHLSAWQEGASIDFTKGVQARIIINEPFEATMMGRQPSEYAKVYMDLCPHSTPGHFNLNKDEVTNQVFLSSRKRVPGCDWCTCHMHTSIQNIARAKTLPPGIDIVFRAYLSRKFNDNENC